MKGRERNEKERLVKRSDALRYTVRWRGRCVCVEHYILERRVVGWEKSEK
jgi:hypothetical protein